MENSSSERAVFDFVERSLKEHGCHIHHFKAGKQSQYVVKKGPRNISVSFDTIYDLVIWVSKNLEQLENAE